VLDRRIDVGGACVLIADDLAELEVKIGFPEEQT
jgi:hypothetical protein